MRALEVLLEQRERDALGAGAVRARHGAVGALGRVGGHLGARQVRAAAHVHALALKVHRGDQVFQGPEETTRQNPNRYEWLVNLVHF